MARFQIGNSGRPKGAKQKLSNQFLTDLAAEWAEHGAEALRICRIEKPTEFVRIVASLMPKELEISDNRLKDIPDDELDYFINFAQRQLQSRTLIGNIEGGETETQGTESPRVLLPVQKAD